MNNNNNIMNNHPGDIDVVDLVSSADEEEDGNFVAVTVQMNIPMDPYAKPSVRYGPGRGGGSGRGGGGGRFNGWYRCYTDKKAEAKMELFKGYAKASVTQTRAFRMYPRPVPVKVEIWCFIRRPDAHFINKIRGPGRLRDGPDPEGVRLSHRAMKPDNDNLAKFILDGLTGIVYADDSQVVDLRVIKSRDNEGTCEGRIAIRCSRYVPQEDWVNPGF